MIGKLIAFAARVAIGKQLVAGIAWANDKAKGNRSEIILAVMGLTFLLKVVGVIPEAAADTINAALAPALPITLAEKFSKAKALIESVAPTPASEPAKDKPL